MGLCEGSQREFRSAQRLLLRALWRICCNAWGRASSLGQALGGCAASSGSFPSFVRAGTERDLEVPLSCHSCLANLWQVACLEEYYQNDFHQWELSRGSSEQTLCKAQMGNSGPSIAKHGTSLFMCVTKARDREFPATPSAFLGPCVAPGAAAPQRGTSSGEQTPSASGLVSLVR